MKKPQTLYRMYDKNNVLLYVGITQQQVVRFYQHAREKSWWMEVDRITVTHYPDRNSVEAAELAAIQSESPRYNIVGNRGAAPRTAFRGTASTSSVTWRPEAMECGLTTRRGGRSYTEPLVLWWEIDHDAISDDYYYEEADEFDLFRWWSRKLVSKGCTSSSMLPIWWSVSGPTTAEFAEQSTEWPDGPYFDKYYYLAAPNGGHIGVHCLPVADKKWTPAQMDKGGFIQQATQWRPTPLQRFAPFGLLCELAAARVT